MDQLLTIDVLGQPFTFKTDTDASNARIVADYLVESVERVKSQCTPMAPIPDKRTILVLTALNIASEYFDLQKKYQELLDAIDKRAANLLNALETRLAQHMPKQFEGEKQNPF